MKRSNWRSLAGSERGALERAGYDVWVENPWHWVVSRFDSPTKLHVWPSAGKVMAYFDSGATLYSNKDQLLEFVDRAFRPELRSNLPTEDQLEAEREVQKLRKGFLDDWGEDDRTIADIDQI